MSKRLTYKGATLGICTTVQNSPLLVAAYAALTYVNIASLGTIGEWGTEDNIINYDTLNDDVTQKQKGISNGGDPEIEFARVASDAGQDAIRTACDTTDYYAFKLTLLDGTVIYNRGLVAKRPRPGGANEDFVVERYALGFIQKEIIVDPV